MTSQLFQRRFIHTVPSILLYNTDPRSLGSGWLCDTKLWFHQIRVFFCTVRLKEQCSYWRVKSISSCYTTSISSVKVAPSLDLFNQSTTRATNSWPFFLIRGCWPTNLPTIRCFYLSTLIYCISVLYGMPTKFETDDKETRYPFESIALSPPLSQS